MRASFDKLESAGYIGEIDAENIHMSIVNPTSSSGTPS